MCELEFATTASLIKELFRRKTFVGVMVFSPDNHRHESQTHSQFTLMSSTDETGAILILEAGIEKLKNSVMEDKDDYNLSD
jgi:hypothetical protein